MVSLPPDGLCVCVCNNLAETTKRSDVKFARFSKKPCSGLAPPLIWYVMLLLLTAAKVGHFSGIAKCRGKKCENRELFLFQNRRDCLNKQKRKIRLYKAVKPDIAEFFINKTFTSLQPSLSENNAAYVSRYNSDLHSTNGLLFQRYS